MTLDLVSNGPKWVQGYAVNQEGSRIGPIHIIDTTTICKRSVMVMNNHYGTLEEITP